VTFGALLAAVAACSADRPRWIAPDRPCPGALRPVWTADPNYTICVATSFRTHDLRTWRREGPGGPPDVLAVQVGVSRAQIDLTGGWPPGLGAPSGHGTAAEAAVVAVRTDTVAGGIARTEIGRRADLAPAMTAVPSFVAGLRTPDGRYVVADGQSTNPATLDTLMLMFRTLARSPVPDPNRRQ
jgi:hypothetical protein